MKIKKKTSLMMLAASTAAVVGVAAVSFAAWDGGIGSLTANASTGNVSLVGFSKVSEGLSAYNSEGKITAGTVADGNTYQFDNKLLPYDQGAVSDTTMSTVISGKLTYEIIGNYEVVVKLASSNIDESSTVYVNISKTAAVTSVDNNALPDEEQTTWTAISATDEATLDVSANAYNAAAVVYVSVIMDSSLNSDMNQSFGLSIELRAKTTA